MGILKTFGQNPANDSLQAMARATNYQQGTFHNLSPTRLMSEDASMVKTIFKVLNKPKNTAPPKALPSVRSELKSIDDKKPVLVWFGHSSYFISLNGKNLLVDPVLSGHASPFSFGAKSFAGTDNYSADDFPVIDLLVITHDHYDHLDMKTVIRLKEKVRHIVTSLGVGSHLRYWGFNPDQITELAWGESTELERMRLTAQPARHFAGRSFVRNKTLWSSFVLDWEGYKIYLGGDSGYDTHFKKIGEQFGPFDLAILECGQYNEQWPDIHMMPELTVQAAIDLRAKLLLPVHWAKFSLALHAWDDPIKRVVQSANERHVKITTPLIGEKLTLNTDYPVQRWWETVS